MNVFLQGQRLYWDDITACISYRPVDNIRVTKQILHLGGNKSMYQFRLGIVCSSAEEDLYPGGQMEYKQPV